MDGRPVWREGSAGGLRLEMETSTLIVRRPHVLYVLALFKLLVEPVTMQHTQY